MEHIDWENERKKIRKESLKNHERLHRLFKEDRLSFERERKKMINEVINGTNNNKIRGNLERLQKSWDNKMKRAGSDHNRLVLAEFFLSKYVNEVWAPSLLEFKRTLDHAYLESCE